MENENPPEPPGSLPFLKGLTAALFILLTVQLYHHRHWFRNIPDKAGAAKPSPAAQANPAPALQPENQKPIHPKLKTSPAPGAARKADPFDSLWTALGAVKKKGRRTPGDSAGAPAEEGVEVPRGKPLPEYALALNRRVEAAGLAIDDAYEDSRDTSLVIVISDKEGPPRKIRLRHGPAFFPGSARVALVLEGFGPALTPDIQALFSSIKVPVTIGVVAKTPFAGRIAQLARRNGWEIVCQVPMETVPFQNLGPGAIYKHYDAKKVQETLLDYQRDLPSFDGYSIYQRGIRIVENEPEILKTLLKQSRREKHFFIDNSFAPRSRVAEFAKPLGVNAQPPLGYVDQLPGADNHVKAAKRYALHIRKTGSGILLFRNGNRSSESLKKILPFFEDQGIQPVFVSSLYE